jgi:hypothetical protein
VRIYVLFFLSLELVDGPEVEPELAADDAALDVGRELAVDDRVSEPPVDRAL